jgi:hypothetical protein
LRIKELQPEASTRAVVKVVGASDEKMRRDLGTTNVAPRSENGSDINGVAATTATKVAPNLTGTAAATLGKRGVGPGCG